MRGLVTCMCPICHKTLWQEEAEIECLDDWEETIVKTPYGEYKYYEVKCFGSFCDEGCDAWEAVHH